jgi:hypothetical protein
MVGDIGEFGATSGVVNEQFMRICETNLDGASDHSRTDNADLHGRRVTHTDMKELVESFMLNVLDEVEDLICHL